jgi:5,5'-dehydrodivanillate O-demethylase
MLSPEKNRILTQVGPGTPMGNLLRRYWMPIAGASEFDTRATKPVRLLGEDLVLYKDLSGTFGLVDRHCPHRRADLAYGFVEEHGLRCNYHGWLMGETGACLAIPYDDVTNPGHKMRDEVRVKAYPVREAAGLLFAYMGPAPVPPLPIWEPFTWTNGFSEVILTDVPCNWFQCQENSCDPVHFEWMHDNWSLRLKGQSDSSPRHLKLAFDEFEHGFLYKRVREGQPENNPMWTVGRVTLWPIGFYLGQHFEWRVPVDDENTLNICWFFARVPKGREPYVQKRIPTWQSPTHDARGEWITSHVVNQDVLAWVGQGRIADRSKEYLSASDRGIVLMRKRYFEEIEKVEAGLDPKGVIRDEELAKCVPLPIANRSAFIDGVPFEDWPNDRLLKLRMRGHPWCAGQPDEVWRDYADAMGLDDSMRTAP